MGGLARPAMNWHGDCFVNADVDEIALGAHPCLQIASPIALWRLCR